MKRRTIPVSQAKPGQIISLTLENRGERPAEILRVEHRDGWNAVRLTVRADGREELVLQFEDAAEHAVTVLEDDSLDH